MNIWRDGYLWEKGHWVNNKFGACSLAAIILELSSRCGINLDRIDVSDLDESVEGFHLDKPISIINSINILRIAYFFDIIANNSNKIKFVKRGQINPRNISANMLVKLSDNSYLEQKIIPISNIIRHIELNFIDHCKEYNNNICHINNENFSNQARASIRLPIVLSNLEGERICKLILKNASIETGVIKFILPITSIALEPTDFITLHYLNYHYQIRVINLKFKHLTIEVTGIIDEISSYYLPLQRNQQELLYEDNIESKFLVLDLPFIFDLDEPYLAIYLQSYSTQALYVSLFGDIEQYYTKILKLTNQTSIGTIVSFENNQYANIFVIDELSKITVTATNLEKFLEHNWNLSICGNEIISFRQCEKISTNLYQISSIVRGCFATEEFMNSHIMGEHFVLLESGMNLLPVSALLENKELYFKIKNLDCIKLNFSNNSQKLLPPFVKNYSVTNGILALRWSIRIRASLRASPLGRVRQSSDENDVIARNEVTWQSHEVISHYERSEATSRDIDHNLTRLLPRFARNDGDFATNDGEYESIINISNNNRLRNFVTTEQYLNINLNELSISGEVNINIISKDKRNYCSGATIIILNI